MVESKQLIQRNINFEVKQLDCDSSQHLVAFNGLPDGYEKFHILNRIRRGFCNLEFMAITRLAIHTNTSMVADEFIGRRLNLVPINSSNSNNLLSTHECYCDDVCENCSVCYELDIYAEHGDIIITSDMLQGPKEYKLVSGIVLTMLRKGQHLKLKAHAQKGTAKQHACFKHASAFYTPEGDFYVETIGNCDPEQALRKVLEQLQF